MPWARLVVAVDGLVEAHQFLGALGLIAHHVRQVGRPVQA